MWQGEQDNNDWANVLNAQVGKLVEPAKQAQFVSFVMQYYAAVPEEDLATVSVDDLLKSALAHWEFAGERASGVAKVRVYNPNRLQQGWESTSTIVEVVNDDMPFLVDTLWMFLLEEGLGVRLTIHPILQVKRDASGKLQEIYTPGAGKGQSESFIRLEVDPSHDAERLARLQKQLEAALVNTRRASQDWPTMRERTLAASKRLRAEPNLRVTAALWEESIAFLEWLTEDQFTFLGYDERKLVRENGTVSMRAIPEQSLGIAIGKEWQKEGPLDNEILSRLQNPEPLLLTKASVKSDVHRRAYLDHIGVKLFDANGQVSGEIRILGLYSSHAMHGELVEIPLLRDKTRRINARIGVRPNSHAGRALTHIFETLPRDELFQSSEDELYHLASGILHLQGRQRTRLFLRADPFGQFYSAVVLLPRERFQREVRVRVEEILQRHLQGRSVESSLHIGDAPLAQLYVIVRDCALAQAPPDVDLIEQEIKASVRTWHDLLQEKLLEKYGPAAGEARYKQWAGVFPPGYVADVPVEFSLLDIKAADQLRLTQVPLTCHLYQHTDGGIRLRLCRLASPIYLSEILPVLENLGLKVLAEYPYQLKATLADEADVWVHDLNITAGGKEQELLRMREIFQEALCRVWDGKVENDGFNRLILATGLGWRQVVVVRAIHRYLVQAGTTFSQAYIERALIENADVSRLLVALFERRFDPNLFEKREQECLSLNDRLDKALEQVHSLDHERISRAFLEVVRAILRTNYFQTGTGGLVKNYLSFKLNPAGITGLPLPLPRYEVFVYSPRVEGVHLRGGKVARGGIRWSDRREDFRTEILGLIKAQRVKNAVIVPVGAKGGFVVKAPLAADRQAQQKEGVECYKIFIRGLLDLTDNYVGGQLLPPPRVVRYDDDDPYLVVAADKGTASFSDTANSIAAEYTFWLGDAFASGGSAGYDHKKMGITARGAWESVKRHFHELGRNAETEQLTVVGVGDMAGDVFGNGLLMSKQLRLVAAFNHKHIFIDPAPDPEASYEERKRLFELSGSQWSDYDAALISPGGGVFTRSTKRIRLTAQIREVLACTAEALSPDELIRTILRAPVDLFWNGGIGTYVKASWERNVEAGDRSNDALRIDGKDLRAKVVAEGGNLGFTQLGRVEYALQGGRINTDFIDNSGGVDCSDHEVNIKILQASAVDRGELSREERNKLLVEMTEEVAGLVLRDNFLQCRALSLMATHAANRLDEHILVMSRLEQRVDLNRSLEYLPNDATLANRRSQGLGLTRPELAVLLAYSKIAVAEALLASNVPEDAYLHRELAEYFPNPLRQGRFFRAIEGHRLRREIIVNGITNSMLNRMGIAFVDRMVDEMAVSPAEVARAYACAREVFGIRVLWGRIEELSLAIPWRAQIDLIDTTLTLVEQASRWFLANPSEMADIAQAVAIYSTRIGELSGLIFSLIGETERQALLVAVANDVATGVPEDLAQKIRVLPLMMNALDIVISQRQSGAALPMVAAIHLGIGEALELSWLRQQIDRLTPTSRWLARGRSKLRDDLGSVQQRLAAGILTMDQAATAEQAVAAWLASHATSVAHWQALLLELRSVSDLEFAALIVALREIQTMARV